MKNLNASRRLFLRHAGAMGALLGPAATALGHGHACRGIDHRPARGPFARQNQARGRGTHIGFPTPPSLAGLRSRSCASRMIAAAVSSIERRVTSITGQP